MPQTAPLPVVIDANMLISLLIARGSKHKLFFSNRIDPASPEFALFEVGKYWDEIVERSRLSEVELKSEFAAVRTRLRTFSLADIGPWLKEAEQFSPDTDDAEYFALALKLDCPIWSEDKLLKKQLRVKVLNTPELMTELGLRGYFTVYHPVRKVYIRW